MRQWTYREFAVKKKKKKMMDNYNYPEGSDNSSAPWNQSDQPKKEIEVLVSVTLSKTVKVPVTDYKIVSCGKDEDGGYSEDIDYSECDLLSAVQNNIVLPQEASSYIEARGRSRIKAMRDLAGWHVDEMECIIDK